jgi:hypothetical protein
MISKIKKFFEIKKINIEEKIKIIKEINKFIEINFINGEKINCFINEENNTYEDFPLYIQIKIGYRKYILKFLSYNEKKEFLNYSDGKHYFVLDIKENKIFITGCLIYHYFQKNEEEIIKLGYISSNEELFFDYFYHKALSINKKNKNYF